MTADSTPSSEVFDVAVIGAGVVGAAIARELAGSTASVVVVEARDDVGDGTSKANTAILHTGFDATPGTLESRLVARGYQLLGAYAEQHRHPRRAHRRAARRLDRRGAGRAPGPEGQGRGQRLPRPASSSAADEVYRRVPRLGPGALGGLTVPGESIICTWTTTLALATDADPPRRRAAAAGARSRAVRTEADHTVLLTTGGEVRARWVVNAAGLGADVVDRLFGHDRFTVTPRRGELLVFDKLTRPMVPLIVLPVPSKVGKGVLVSPTIYGNVMLGPTAEDLTDKGATGTSEAGFDFLLDKGRRLMPDLLDEEVTASYAGLRAATEHGDYLIDVDADAAVRARGRHPVDRADGRHGDRRARPGAAGRRRRRPAGPARDLPPPPRMPNLGEAFPRPYQDAERIAADPDYGTIVCFCERVTRRRDPRRLRLRPPAGRPRRAAPAHPRAERPLPGLLLRRSGEQPSRRAPFAPCEWRCTVTTTRASVVVIGGGPSGLTAAAALAPDVDGEVLVLDREAETGGIPRHSDHLGYGIRDLRRVALRAGLRAPADRDGARRRCHPRDRRDGDRLGGGRARLEVTSPRGRRVVEADAVVLATGARERPRAGPADPRRPARRVSTPPASCRTSCTCTTPRSGTRAVVVGAELVSWSAVLTLREAGCSVAALVSALPARGGLRRVQPARPQRAAHARASPAAGWCGSTAGSGCARSRSRRSAPGAAARSSATPSSPRATGCPTTSSPGSAGSTLDAATRGPVVDASPGRRRCPGSSRSATWCTRSTPPTLRPSTVATSPVRSRPGWRAGPTGPPALPVVAWPTRARHGRAAVPVGHPAARRRPAAARRVGTCCSGSTSTGGSPWCGPCRRVSRSAGCGCRGRLLPGACSGCPRRCCAGADPSRGPVLLSLG